MDTGIIENNKTQMRRGVLEYSILLILAGGDGYASSIIQKLKEVNIIVAEGTIYPLLIRLKKLELLTYRWEESTQGPPRKYYMITTLGREQLAVAGMPLSSHFSAAVLASGAAIQITR